MEQAMAQLVKIADAARLTGVQKSEAAAAAAAAKVAEPAPAGADQIESRSATPRQPDARTDKGAAVGAFKVNRKRVLMGAAAALMLAAGWFGWGYVTTGRFMVSTDDAYVRANNTTLGAKVSGYVSEFLVEDN